MSFGCCILNIYIYIYICILFKNLRVQLCCSILVPIPTIQLSVGTLLFNAGTDTDNTGECRDSAVQCWYRYRQYSRVSALCCSMLVPIPTIQQSVGTLLFNAGTDTDNTAECRDSAVQCWYRYRQYSSVGTLLFNAGTDTDNTAVSGLCCSMLVLIPTIHQSVGTLLFNADTDNKAKCRDSVDCRCFQCTMNCLYAVSCHLTPNVSLLQRVNGKVLFYFVQ